MSSMRLATDDDVPLISRALLDLEKFSPAYGWVAKPSLEAGIEFVMHKIAEGNAYVGKGYLLLVSEFSPWYSEQKVLQEDLVLKIEPVGSISRVLRFIETLARERKADLVIVGNSYIRDGLSNIYHKRLGYKHLSNLFYKDLHE